MLLKNNSEKVKILVRYFETLSMENKLKLFIIVLESDMIKLKIDKENLIEFFKNFLCVFDKNYNKNIMVTLEYNMDVFILSKVIEINKTEKENFVFELTCSIYNIIKKIDKKYINNEKCLTITNKCFILYIVLYKDVKLWKMK